MARAAEIHVGDWPIFVVRLADDGVPYDPTTATTAQIKFVLPDASVLTKDATVTTVSGFPVLTYAVVSSSDVTAQAGLFTMQVSIVQADGAPYRTQVQDRDSQGRLLRIYPNVD